MQDEAARTDAGFGSLPGVEAALRFDAWAPSATDPVHPPLIPSPHIWGTSRQQPPAATQTPPPQPTPMSDATLAAMRLCLPNLKILPDEVMRSMNPLLLLQLNAGTQAQPAQSQDAVALAAAAAAHFAQSTHKSSDPGIKMARALDKLRDNPVMVPAGPDDRISVLHIARFLAGTVLSAKKQWLLARDILCFDGVEPLSTYDMGACGLQGTVTMKGWSKLGNPGSMNLCLKHFSPTNIGTSGGFSRRFSLAEGESAINVGDDFKEISDMKCFERAMRSMTLAARMAMPWNYSFPALDNFIVFCEHGLVELAGSANRVGELTNFVNHVLAINAQNWVTKEPFLTTPELKGEFAIWVQNRPVIPAASTPGGQSKSWGRGKGPFRHSNQSGFHSNRSSGGGAGTPMGGFQPARGRGSGGHAGRGGAGAGGASANSLRITCKNYNRDACPNHYTSCFLQPSGDKAFHVCSALKADGAVCGGYHPATQHR